MNITELAKQIGVSKTAVSYALRGKGRLSASTREMILARIEELGYRPSRIAHALATGRTQVIEFWSYGVYPSFFGYTVHCFMQVLRDTDYEMRIVDLEEGLDPRVPQGGATGWPVDGIVAFGAARYVEEYLGRDTLGTTPIISMGFLHTDKMDFVNFDVYGGAVEAVRHLVRTGRKRIAYMAPYMLNRSGEGRHDGYREAMGESGLVTEHIGINSGGRVFDRSVAREEIKDYVLHHGYPEALFCFNDDVAIGACRGLHDMGIRIADDIAIVGYDGIEETEYHNPTISTVVQPIEEMCKIAWRLLQQRIQDPTRPYEGVTLKTNLVARESSIQTPRLKSVGFNSERQAATGVRALEVMPREM